MNTPARNLEVLPTVNGSPTPGLDDPETGLNPARWAARYAATGLPVLPLHTIRDGRCSCGRADCHSPGKHPLTRAGKDDASTDLDRVAGWWRRWPRANVGLRPPCGLVVLDVDPRNGGATALFELTRRHGQLPPTLTARTGSGGLHIWLGYGGPARGRLCPGVDVKTNSGYLVAPPSRHTTGRRYQWVTGLPTAPAPRWLRHELDPPTPPVPVVPRVGGGARLDGLLRHVAQAPEGELNSRLYWAACRAHEAGLDTGPLVELAVSMGHPPRGAVNTAASAGKAPPRRVVTR